MGFRLFFFFFFFNDTATTEIYTLSLHDALPIFRDDRAPTRPQGILAGICHFRTCAAPKNRRSEEHTSELQSQSNLVCRLLLEKKKKKPLTPIPRTIIASPELLQSAHLLIRHT